MSSPPDVTSTPLHAVAQLDLDKSAGRPVDVNKSSLTDAGDTIRYRFEVQNTGNVTLDDVAVVDPRLADAGIDVACAPTTLAPGATAACTASAPYVVTEADEAAGAAVNVATATATDPRRRPGPQPRGHHQHPGDRRPGQPHDHQVGRRRRST